MQKYLNAKSKNGFHIEKIGKLRCVFTEDAGKRYIYALCRPGNEGFYTSSPDWEHIFTHKSVIFFRKAVPPDAVCIERKFKKRQSALEENWLNAKLLQGLVLIGKTENEYVFGRSGDYRFYKYRIKHVNLKKSKKNNEDPASSVKPSPEMKFVTVSDSGSTYYFLADNKIRASVKENRGKRVSDLLLAAFAAAGAALGFCAALFLTVYGTVKASAAGNSVKPWLISGCCAAAVFAVIFIIFFMRFQKISELRRIMAQQRRALLLEERRRAEEEAAKAREKTKSDPTNNNTVVMNTVVLNNYRKKRKKNQNMANSFSDYDADFSESVGQMFDPAVNASGNPALDPELNPALKAARNPGKLAKAIIDGSIESGDGNGAVWDGVWETEPSGGMVYGEKTPINGDEEEFWESGKSVHDRNGSGKAKGKPGEHHNNTAMYGSGIRNARVSASEDFADESGDEISTENSVCGNFPLMKFIGNAVLCLACVVIFSLAVRFSISWFSSLGNGNFILLVLSLLSIGFSPLIFYSGFSVCRNLIMEHGSDSSV